MKIGTKFNKKILGVSMLLLIALIAMVVPTKAQGSDFLDYKGKITNLTDETTITSGDASCIVGGADTCDFRVNLYDEAAGGNLLFQEVHQNIEIGDYNSVFQFYINSVCLDWAAQASPPANCTGTPTVDGVDWSADSTIYIEIEFDDDGNGDFSSPETFDRKLINTNPYAYFAQSAGSLAGLNIENFILLQSGSAQEIDASTSDSIIFLNENGSSTPNFVEFKVGGTDQFVIDNDGNVSIGSGSDAFLDIKAATTSSAQINFSSSAGVDPSTPIAGDIWFNGTKFFGYNGTDYISFLDSGAIFFDAGDVTYLTDTAEDFALGGSTIANSIFSIDTGLGDFYFGSSGTVDPSFIFENSNSAIANFNINDTNSFEFTNSTTDVKVGINTDAPETELDVVGDIQLSGDLQTNSENIESQLEWVKRAGGVSVDHAYDVAADSDGFAYVTGSFQTSSVDFDEDNVVAGDTSTELGAYLAKYDSEGVLQWLKAPTGTLSELFRAVAVDSADNIYVAGYFSGTSDFEPDAVVSGDTPTSAGGADILIAKYNSGGTLQWVKALGSTGSEQATNISIDGSNNVYVTGFFTGTVDFDEDNVVSGDTRTGSGEIFVAKYNSSGTLQWVKDLGDPDSTGEYVNINADTAGNVYITGNYEGNTDFDPDNVIPGDTITETSSQTSMYFAKYNTSGVLQWVRVMSSPSSSNIAGAAVSDGTSVYLTGVIYGTLDFDTENSLDYDTVDPGSGSRIFIAKYDDTSAMLTWVKTFANNSSPRVSDINLWNENIIISGGFPGTVDFDEEYEIENDTHTTEGGIFDDDGFMAAYGPEGQLIKAWHMKGSVSSDDTVHGVDIDPDGNIFAVGDFRETVDFEENYAVEGDTHVSGGNQDIFIAKYLGLNSYGGSDIGSSLKPFENLYATNLFVTGTARIDGDLVLTDDFSYLTPVISYGSIITEFSPNDIGEWSDITLNQDGNPVIAYSDITDTDLGITVCGNPTCTSGNVNSTYSYSTDNGDLGVSVVVNDSNLPIVSFHSTNATDHIVLLCSVPDCSSASQVALDTIGAGRYSDIIMRPDGTPIMFSQHGPDDRLESRDCATIACNSYGVVVINDDTATNTGVYPAGTIKSDGFVALAYHDETNGDLKLMNCDDSDCSGDTGRILIDENTTPGSADSGEWPAVVTGREGYPLIAYQDTTNTDVYLLICQDLSCSTFESVEIAVSADDTGDYQIGLATKINGSPVVTYYNATDGTLNLYECANPICSSGINHELTDGTDDQGRYSSIVRTSNNSDTFAISYHNETDGNLEIYSFEKTVTSGSLGSVNNFFSALYTIDIYTKNASISNFDIAEEYFVDDTTIEAGDVVRFKKESNSNLTIERTTSSYDEQVIGVISTEPGLYLKSWEESNEKSRPVALVGRVPVKVTNENGPIKKGDYLTTSSTPGYAMKASSGGFIIGRAVDDFATGEDGDSELVKQFLEEVKVEAEEYVQKYSDIETSTELTEAEKEEVRENIESYNKRIEDLTAEIDGKKYQNYKLGRIMMYVDLSYVGENAYKNDPTEAFTNSEGIENIYSFFKLSDRSISVSTDLLTLKGDVTLEGDLDVFGSITATDAKINYLKVVDKIKLPERSSGNFTLSPTNSQTFIESSLVGENSFIFLTSNDPTVQIEIIDQIPKEGFTIETNKPISTDLKVHYVIIN